MEREDFTEVAREGDRALWINWKSRTTQKGEVGSLVHAAVSVGNDWREQTIYEPNYLARMPRTIANRLRTWPEERLTPQRITGL